MKIIELLLKLINDESFVAMITALVFFIIRLIEKPKAEKKAIEKYKKEHKFED
jgi:hypothetical protein